jgi:2-iminobutanoate/2-iminopropanoate deaminase
MKKAIESNNIPKAIGPYSAAIMTEKMIFTAGQLGIDPNTGQFAGESIESQTKQALLNMGAILEQAGCTFKNVVKTTVFLADIGEFSAMNEVYATFFTPPYPARSAFQVACLPRNALVEIEAIVIRE